MACYLVTNNHLPSNQQACDLEPCRACSAQHLARSSAVLRKQQGMNRGSALRRPEDQDASSSVDRQSTEHGWQLYFNDSTQWLEKRSGKHDFHSPDFRDKISGEQLWIENLKTPEWVKDSLTKGVRQSENRSCSPSKIGNVHKRSLHLNEIKELHADMIKGGKEFRLSETNTLMDMYMKCGSMADALHVFDNMPKRNAVSWNVMILGCAKQGEGELGLELYARMHQEGVQPSDSTFVGALKACSSLAALEDEKQGDGKFMQIQCLEKGRAIHSQILKSGLEPGVFLGTTLVDMYAKCGCMNDACHVFGKLPHQDVVSWTAMILGYAKQEDGMMALKLYAQMHKVGVQPNDRTVLGALKACSSLAALEEGRRVDGKLVKSLSLENGRAIHSQIVKSGFELDVYVGTAMVDMYAKCGSMQDAWHVFDKLPYHNLVSWTAIIMGCAEQEENEEAFKLYARMQEQGLSANSWTFVSILKACGNTAALETGKELQNQICRAGLETTTIVANALIDMYAKCGSMVDAKQLFDALPRRDVVTWNALIAGYARQGEIGLVFSLLEQMQQEGMQPDGITLLSVLIVCSHAGLTDKGQMYFQVLSKQYGIVLTIEHYSCMVDLLCRAGQLNEAVAMVQKMPCQPDAVVWLTVLAACRKWQNVEFGRHAFESVVRLDDKRDAAYVLMSNIYAHAHMWEDSEKISLMRKNAQARKKPGQSWWTDADGIVHTFVVGDRVHPQSKDLYAKLKVLSIKMKEEGFDSMSWPICDDGEEDALCGHSEKLAIACALINTVDGTPIRIVKNLQVCDDCHKATALISKIERRNIICRDASRIHDYKDGKCSCGGYFL